MPEYVLYTVKVKFREHHQHDYPHLIEHALRVFHILQP